MNRISVFIWLLKVLDSCKTIEHFNNAKTLVKRHYNLYEDIGMNEYLIKTYYSS